MILTNYKEFRVAIRTFRNTLAPTDRQRDYLAKCENDVYEKLMAESKRTGQTFEMCLLTSLCGELKTKQQQAEFASRLLLLDILMRE